MLEAVGGGVASQVGGSGSGAADLEKGVGALKRFQSKVNALLTEFENSAAGSTKVADQSVTRAAFSGANLPFAEADGFFKQYNRVHSSLVKLSRSLGDQIEMLQIAVHASEVGYDNLEEDLRQRFYAIQTRLETERERAQEAAAEREGSTGSGSSAGSGGSEGSGSSQPAEEPRNSGDSFGSGDFGGSA